MVQKISIDGRPAWLKIYGRSSRMRSVMNWLWNRIVVARKVGPLAAPPRHTHEQAKQVELRRIRQLLADGVCVPQILGEGPRSLLLSDLGPSLARQLKTADDVPRIDLLTALVVSALAAAHDDGAYFGQAFPRNITVSDDRIGFIDFEDDPLEIMSLRDAQARDWLMFAAGVGRFYHHREEALAAMFEAPLDKLPDVRAEIARVVARLVPLEKLCRHMGQSAGAYCVALLALRLATGD